LGRITSNIRLITIGWDSLKSFHLRSYYDNIPSEDDVEEMEIAISEIISDISFYKVLPADCIFSTASSRDLKGLKCVVYARKEEE
jgi:hypothetical protein